MTPDLIIYAIVAAGLVLWLRNILGTRHGSERERPNPFTIQPAKAETDPNTTVNGGKSSLTASDKISALAANPAKVASVENKTAENGLLSIARIDGSFDIDFFLEGAQEAFVMIVEAFAKGDRETLKDLLNDNVYQNFEGAIAQREQSGETMETEILAVRRAAVSEARVEGRMALITVKFHADELSVTRDENGNVTGGHAERIVPMRDIWTFGRDLRSKDPRWLVYETRGDIEGDNETIPNTH